MLITGMNLFGATRILTTSINTQTNTVSILDGCEDYKVANMAGIVDFSTIENPSSVKQTGSISILVKDSGQNSIS